MRAASDAGRALISGAPKVFESFVAQFGIAGRMLNSAMAKPRHQCPLLTQSGHGELPL
jgi:hypothetical protein